MEFPVTFLIPPPDDWTVFAQSAGDNMIGTVIDFGGASAKVTDAKAQDNGLLITVDALDESY